MTRRLLTYTLALACIGSLSSCILNPSQDVPEDPPKDPDPPENLTENWHVLRNLELAYGQTEITLYNELVDIDEYIFFFEPSEPDGSWTRDEDQAATKNMFSGKESNNPLYGRINSINMELSYDGVQWNRVQEPGFENEIWEEITVNYLYDFSVEPDFNFINGSDAKAVFTVRQVFDADDDRIEWRLVRWRDLGFN